MDAERRLAIAVGSACLVGIAVVLRRLWLAATNPEVAYRLGRKARHAVENAAHVAGQASGAVGEAASVVTGKFQEGRDSARSTKRTDQRDEA